MEEKNSGCAVMLIIVALFVGWNVYLAEWRVVTVDTERSNDGAYELKLQTVGEPFLFGPAPGRIVLKSDDKVITKIDFKIYNDGASFDESAWSVLWYEDRAKITLSGSEQGDRYLTMYFDGEVEKEWEKVTVQHVQKKPEPEIKKPTPEEKGPSEEEKRIYNGYRAIYLYLADEASVDFELSHGAKESSVRCILKENDETVEYLIYDRQSKNGDCGLYVHYQSEKDEDGIWSLSDGRMMNTYAYVYESGAVVSSGITDWDDTGSEEYRQVTGE